MSYLLFSSVGVILLLLAIVLKLVGQELGYEVFLNLGISVTAVTIVEYIWKQVGGDPISKAIDRLRIATLLRTKYRILIFDPTSELAAQRAREENKRQFLPTIEQSLAVLQEMRLRLDPEVASTYLQVRVVKRVGLYCRIVRADDMMLVTKYLCHSSGSSSPTVELHGEDTAWFGKFAREFDRMWGLAAERPTPSITLDKGEP